MIGSMIRALVRQRFLVIAVTLTIALMGVVAFQNLIIDVFPDPSPALVQIYTEAEGLAPQEVESFITFPVETSMSGLPKVEQIRSVSKFGLSVVTVVFVKPGN